jgi:hypothetical protein
MLHKMIIVVRELTRFILTLWMDFLSVGEENDKEHEVSANDTNSV